MEIDKVHHVSPDDARLLAIYLITCLVPGIPLTISIFHDEKGAA
jgi:hypothetical protein